MRDVCYISGALVAEILHGVAVPAGWEQRARESFLDGYMNEVDQMLLPAGSQAISKLLAMFELEKLVYELRYELEHRPDWVAAPVQGIVRMLDEAV